MQQQCIEVQFRLENTYIQLRVWLQRKNKNDWIVLRERRKYYLWNYNGVVRYAYKALKFGFNSPFGPISLLEFRIFNPAEFWAGLLEAIDFYHSEMKNFK